MADYAEEMYHEWVDRRGLLRKVGPPRANTASTLRNQIAALASEVVRIEALPKEPDAKAIRFKKRYAAAGQNGAHWYTYGAFRVRPNLWYVTGRVTNGFTWDQLLNWIGDEHLHTIRVAVEWRKLETEE